MKRPSPVLLQSFRMFGALTCLSTALPVLHSRRWWIRIMDFPRLQLAAIGGLTLLAGLAARRDFTRADRWLAGLTGVSVLAQLAQFAKYTPISPKQVRRSHPHRDSSLSILVANVRMRNPSAQRLKALVEQRNPDMVLLLEPNECWARQLASLGSRYPFKVTRPLENTYGLILWSRLPLIEPRVRFLVHNDVPSVTTRVRLRNGCECWFYGLHPRPPVRGNLQGELEFQGSAPRDAELVMVAIEIRELRTPVIVAGDFNDVAWSHTTRRFQRLSRTLDPRVGRGLFSTYHAGSRLIRFPLDHLFISEHFAIGEFLRESDIGSDHFPLFAQVVMTPDAPREQEPPAVNRNDFAEAKDAIAEAGKQ